MSANITDNDVDERSEFRSKRGGFAKEKSGGPAPPKDLSPPNPRQPSDFDSLRIRRRMIYAEFARPSQRDLVQVEGDVLPVLDLGPKDFELVGINVSPQQFSETLIALANFCRACGGIGLGVGTFGVISNEE